MKILVLGGDGYLGWPTALHLSARGHEVTVVDNLVRREYDREMGVDSLVPIASARGAGDTLGAALRSRHRRPHRQPHRRRLHLRRRRRGRARRHRALRRAALGALLHDRPRARGLHAGQQRGRERSTSCTPSQRPTPTSTWSSSGRWGSTGIPTSTSRRASSRSPTRGAPTCCPIPKQPGSFYHLSKVHDSHNIMFACRVWGLRATDLNQGIVYGQSTDGDRPRSRPGHPLRLRRRLRHGAQPLLRPGGHRPPAHRLRRRRPDPRHAQHPRHAGLRRPWPSRTRPSAASSGCSTSSPSRSPCATWPRWSSGSARPGSTSPRACPTPGSRTRSTTSMPPTPSSSTSGSSRTS